MPSKCKCLMSEIVYIWDAVLVRKGLVQVMSTLMPLKDFLFRRFIGLVSYFRKFIQNLSTTVEENSCFRNWRNRTKCFCRIDKFFGVCTSIEHLFAVGIFRVHVQMNRVTCCEEFCFNCKLPTIQWCSFEKIYRSQIEVSQLRARDDGSSSFCRWIPNLPSRYKI